MADCRYQNRIGAVIFALLFLSYCYFFQSPWNWNSITRTALGISMVDEGTLNINKFESQTGDKSFFEGNYYSDKAPGATFTALPAIAVSKLYLDTSAGNYKWLSNKGKISGAFIFVNQVATVVACGLFTALAALALYFTAVKLGASLSGAAFGALCFGLATPAWGWVTIFFGHGLAGATLFLGMASVVYLSHSTTGRQDIVLGFVSGALLSWAVVVDYTSAPVSLLIAIYGIIQARSWDHKRLVLVLSCAVTGGLIFLFPLLLYNYSIYGEIFTTGYKHLTDFPGVKEGFYGIEFPRGEILIRMLIGPRNGILWFCPIFIMTPYALYRLWNTPGKKGLAMVIILITLYYFLWNSGYQYWRGGAATGPRFLIPILPFLSLSIALLWSKAGRYLKIMLIVLFVISFLISLVSVSISMLDLEGYNINLFAYHRFPKFLEMTNYKISYLVRLILPSFNGSSQLHLMPLYIILAVGLSYIIWLLNKTGPRRAGS